MAFYKTVVTITVLSNDPVNGMALADIDYEMTEGGWSGVTDIGPSEEVSKEEMAELLVAQGSDPEFLGAGEGDE